MLNSEEKRAQIEILRRELEKKLIDGGFMNFFLSNNSSENLSHIDIFLEMQNIKQKLLDKDENYELMEKLVQEK